MAVGVVAEIKGRLPVADVVGETVQLKKAGTTLKGLCPFHGEKTPSFVVTPARDTWHCFGCGKHGDIFTFVMERDTLAFPEALKQLAARAGVELDERTKREDAHNATAAHGPRGRHRLLPRGPDGFEDRGAGAGLSPRPRLHGRDHREAPAGLGAGWLGPAGPPAGHEAPGDAAGAARGGPGQPAPAERRRVRPLPRTRHLPDPRRERPPVGLGGRILGKEGEDGADPAPSTSTRRPPRCSTRAARCTSSTARRRRSARPVRPSSSRATRTR